MVLVKSTYLLLFGVLGSLVPTIVDASNGCCSLNYKTCINWCGKTKKSCRKCKHKDGVSWLKSGPQQNCKKRWKGCATSPDSCCDGLICREDKNDFKMCLPPKKGSNKKNDPLEKPPDSKSTPSYDETGGVETSPFDSDSDNKGCCTLDFVSCIDWCGPTKDSCLNCNHHDGVGWMKNGPPTDQCLSRWTGCGNNRNACCDGLVCKPDANNYLMCLPSFLSESTLQTDSPTASPTTRPSDSPSSVPSPSPSSKPSSTPSSDPSSSPSSSPSVTPSVSPSSAPTLSPTKALAKPCCSLDFKNCINWCGPSYDTCSNCNHHDGVGWLYNGAPKDNTCLSRWTGCGNNPDGCCDGMVCKEDDNSYLMCLPTNLIGTKVPTSEPTSKPTMMSTNKPTFSVVVSTDEPTTLSPTLSMTTNNPTAKETELSTTFSPSTKTTTTSDVPTDTPTASPTEYPTFLPTKLTLEPTSATIVEEPADSPTASPTVYPTFHPTELTSDPPTESKPTEFTSDPSTDSPTVSPTEYPTFHPTQLTSEPTSTDTTFEPTSADTTFEPTASNLCMDDPELSFKDDTTKDCSWVRKNFDNRCERKWNGKKLVDFCPVSCGVCPPTGLSSRRKLLRGQN